MNEHHQSHKIHPSYNECRMLKLLTLSIAGCDTNTICSETLCLYIFHTEESIYVERASCTTFCIILRNENKKINWRLILTNSCARKPLFSHVNRSFFASKGESAHLACCYSIKKLPNNTLTGSSLKTAHPATYCTRKITRVLQK